MSRWSDSHGPERVIDRTSRRDGYIILLYDDGSRELEHRAVMRWHLGALPEGSVVHHLNHDPSDNRIENLQVVASQSAHASLHGKPCQLDCTCKRHTTYVRTPEHRAKMSAALKGKPKSQQHRANLSAAQKIAQADRERDQNGRFASTERTER